MLEQSSGTVQVLDGVVTQGFGAVTNNFGVQKGRRNTVTDSFGAVRGLDGMVTGGFGAENV